MKRDGTNLFGIVLEACGHAEVPDEANTGTLNMNYPDGRFDETRRSERYLRFY